MIDFEKRLQDEDRPSSSFCYCDHDDPNVYIHYWVYESPEVAYETRIRLMSDTYDTIRPEFYDPVFLEHRKLPEVRLARFCRLTLKDATGC